MKMKTWGTTLGSFRHSCQEGRNSLAAASCPRNKPHQAPRAASPRKATPQRKQDSGPVQVPPHGHPGLKQYLNEKSKRSLIFSFLKRLLRTPAEIVLLGNASRTGTRVKRRFPTGATGSGQLFSAVANTRATLRAPCPQPALTASRQQEREQPAASFTIFSTDPAVFRDAPHFQLRRQHTALTREGWSERRNSSHPPKPRHLSTRIQSLRAVPSPRALAPSSCPPPAACPVTLTPPFSLPEALCHTG